MPPSPALVLAEQLIDQRRFDQARATLMRHLQKSPRDGHACDLLAVSLTMSGRPDQALFYAQRARTLLPGDLNVLSNLANVLSSSGKHAEAADLFRQVLDREPDRQQVRRSLAAILLGENLSAEAADIAQEGLRQTPGDPNLTTLLAGAHLASGRPAQALSLFESALKQQPDNPGLLIARATTSNYVDGLDPEQIAAMHRAAGDAVVRRSGPPLTPSPTAHPAESPLRIGLVSSDLRWHSVAFFIEPLLRALDRSQFEPVCFSSSPSQDQVTARLRALVPEWHDIHALSDADAAALMRRERIDILIDLAGLGSGNRLGIFARAPAPVQATYLGYPNTTGLTSIGHRIVDSITDPPGFESRYTERLLRLPGCFVCYTPLGQALPEPSPRKRAPGEGPVFGSFNATRKLTDSTVTLWSRLVASVPGARLVLKAAPLREKRTRDATVARFAAAGLDPSRLELLAWVDTDPMLLYDRIDIALDPFPYNGTTTTCEALWMGVPVVTLEGNTHAARVGTSILTHLGLTDLIAKTPDDYAQIATTLATNPTRLDTLRQSLRLLLTDRLCNAPAFAHEFGEALQSMWTQSTAPNG